LKKAIIMGAGPAGLTAALEFLNKTNIMPIVLEKSDYMGGISRTLNYKGNRMDIGGHRFFSKSDRVMKWWLDILPIEKGAEGPQEIAYQGKRHLMNGIGDGPCPDKIDNVMLVRHRKSRIYFLGKFFDYPISLSQDTLMKLGFFRTLKIGLSYMKSAMFPIKNVTNLEQFFINRFGKELYLTFFKEYTEKVWGIACSEISSEWGEQRIKGLSITKAISHFLKTKMASRKINDISQKSTETSLIEKFLYPKLGPGQMWEEVARQVRKKGGLILTDMEVVSLDVDGKRVPRVTAKDTKTGDIRVFDADYVISTLPVKELIRSMKTEVEPEIKDISDGLLYRDFITVGILLNKLKVKDSSQAAGPLVTDNWIYIQEPGVLAGRLQIFNNWSPYMVKDSEKVWIGVEYFCNESDAVWTFSDKDMADLAVKELHKIGILDSEEVLDTYVYHMPKTYPAYFGTYDRFDQLRDYIDQYENLFLVGRNGMHKYNNQDHSMLTAMLAVENINAGITDKSNIWAVNTEMAYHEQKEEAAVKEETAEAVSA
jgi:protoporphyrinogen oxidase